MDNSNKGKLWLVGIPIGNKDDLSPRAKSTLENADLILAEDTRKALNNFKYLEISAKNLMSFHDQNEEARLPQVLALLEEGKTLALISDAGMPCIADPGYLLVQACRENNIFVSVVPGPNSALTALASSGLAPQPFTFFGFLPRKKGEIMKLFAPYKPLNHSLIFFERKDRILESLQAAFETLGDRELCLARELTKIHEEIILSSLAKPKLPENLLGEFTVIIGPSKEKLLSPEDEILALIKEASSLNLAPKQLAKHVQNQAQGWSSSDIYKLIIEKK